MTTSIVARVSRRMLERDQIWNYQHLPVCAACNVLKGNHMLGASKWNPGLILKAAEIPDMQLDLKMNIYLQF